MNYLISGINGSIQTSVPHAWIATAEGQKVIERALHDGHALRCGCRGNPSSPLVVRRSRGGLWHLARQPRTEQEHHIYCPHGDLTQVASRFGLPEHTIRWVGGQLEIDIDGLFKIPPRPSGVGGQYQHNIPNLGPRLHRLAMFLLEASGLTSIDPLNSSFDPWRRLQNSLRNMRASGPPGSTVEGQTLLPSAVYPSNSAKVNFAKLMRKVANRRPRSVSIAGTVLIGTLMPAGDSAPTVGSAIDLSETFDIRGLTIEWSVLSRAWSRCPGLAAHRASGRPILAVGMAAVRTFGKGVHLTTEQLTLIPVGPLLTPTPTPYHWDSMANALAGSSAYRFDPAHDSQLML